MPRMLATCRFSDVARIAMPYRVRVTNRCSATIEATATLRMNICEPVTEMKPRS